MARALRIALLLFLLATVAQWTWIERRRVTEWRETLRVVVYPIDADGSPATAAYLDRLDRESLREIDEWVAAQAREHGLALARPVETYLGPRVRALPPDPPRDAGPFDAIRWSLAMRWWASRNDAWNGPTPHVRLFVLYHDPDRRPRLGHSTGLAKGMIGVVRVFASARQQGANNMVIAHELLHTFGASDKYDPATNRPRFPDGYAEPAIGPEAPQRYAEIMAGRTPRGRDGAAIPVGLAETVIGAATAAEIHWLRAPHGAR